MSQAQTTYDIVVIGGGAAGFFGAINAAKQRSGLRIIILEKSPKLLSKVRISGGGRCNVTHDCVEPNKLSKHYPRGSKELKTLFRQFNATHTVSWFEEEGVRLKVEPDGRMFPTTDHSETIINCFLELTNKYGIEIKTNFGVTKIVHSERSLHVTCENGEILRAKKVLLATGGHPQAASYQWLKTTGHSVVPPIPSLFTFNDSKKELVDLMGIAVADATVKIAGSTLSQRGPVLITHWGLSGPAVIKLSAWAAKELFDKNYVFTALVNWTGEVGEDEVRRALIEQKGRHPKKGIFGNPQFSLPSRLWEKLLILSGFEEQLLWGDAPNKKINRLVELLVRCPFHIKGKTTFKEEFVTCGGVPWNEINLETMESKIMPGLYFAGEVINVDGETGGFNFQAAWTTAWVAAQAMASTNSEGA